MKWISIKDELPKELVDVLTYHEGHESASIECYFQGDWTDSYEASYSDKPTYWMPLPKPPTAMELIKLT